MYTASQIHQYDLEIEPALRDFMGSNFCDLNDCVDWVCYTFDVNADDWLIDRIADVYEEFFGVWQSLNCPLGVDFPPDPSHTTFVHTSQTHA